MGVLKTIFTILLIYYAFKFVAKLALPFLLKYFINKAGSKFQQQFNQKQTQSKSEGEISIDGKVKQESKLDTSIAEDVDFEEV